MRTIIAGSRTIEHYSLIVEAIQQSGFYISEVVSGCAAGVDRLGEDWAAYKAIPVRRFPADWRTHGKAAGPIRNDQMARYADALVAIRQGGAASRGTTDMIARARARGLRVFVYEVEA